MSDATSILLAFALLTTAIAPVATIPVSTATSAPTSDATALPARADSSNSSASSGVVRPAEAGEPAIVAVHPNPVADGDPGEFVVLYFPERTDLSGWAVSDGEDTVALPNRTVVGRLAVSPDPTVARNLTEHPVAGVDDLALANGGERITLQYRGTTVDEVRYEDAPEGETWRDGRWHHRLATNRSPANLSARSVRAFVLPDAPGVPLEAIQTADRRILLAGYSFTSERVAWALRRAARRGVDVRVLVDAAPVGGIAHRERRLLDSLAAAGVDVAVVGGDRSPYAFHHAKYAVVDDRALVLTENWKAAGTGGHSSRGWGALVESAAVADELAAVFAADHRVGIAIEWGEYREKASYTTRSVANGSFPRRFDSKQVPVENVRVLVTPDNAETELAAELRNADRSIRIEQVSMDRGPLLNATVDAARRGARVRILLSSAWYVREENRRLVEALNERAAREGLDLQAQLVEPRSRFEKVHAKGAVIDGDQAVVGSLNWNHRSATRNREVVLVLEGERVGTYFARVFRADWRGGAWRLPVSVIAALAVVLATALAVARRRIRFDGDPETTGDGDLELPDSEIHGW